jgi:hypothetical protein
MSDHQGTLAQVVKWIEVSFDKIKSYGEKVDQYRISAGKQLVELQARIEAGEDGEGVKWWSWYAEHFKKRTRRDAQKVMKLARADDPEAAAEEERTKARDGMAAHGRRVAASNVSRDSQPASPPTEYRLTEKEYAEQIVRDVERELANLDDQGLDLDLVRELILSKLKFSFNGGDSAEETAEQRKALYQAAEDTTEAPKTRGRPPGSKNKPKEPAAPTPVKSSAAPTDNDTSTDQHLPADGSIPGFLDRRADNLGGEVQ